MKIPAVTIACTTYNHEKYIRECIEGFLFQKTNFPIEIIIHDDASTDKTPEIIKEYEDKHPNLFIPIFQNENKYSKNIKPMLNIVFPQCKGKYIAMCEGDDYWTDPYKLEKQVQYLDNHPNCVISFHNAMIKNEDDKNKSRNFHAGKIDPIIDINKLISRNYIPTASSIFRKAAFPKMPEYISQLTTCDWFLHLMLIQQGTADYMDEVMSVYRIHSKGVARDRVKIHSSAIRMLHYFSQFSSNDQLSVLSESIKNQSRLLVEELIKRIRKLMKWGKYREAAECFDTIRDTVSEFNQVLIDLENKALLKKAKKEIANNNVEIAEKYLSGALNEAKMPPEMRSEFVLALGDCYHISKSDEKEKALYSDEIATGRLADIDKFGPLLRLGNLFTTNGDFEAAESAYKECLNINDISDSKLVDTMLALSLCLKNRGSKKQAMQELIRIANLKHLSERQYFLVHFNLGDIYKKNNELENAINNFTKCIMIESITNEMRCEAVLSLARCFRQQGNLQKALQELIRISELDTLSDRLTYQVHFNLGDIYKTNNEFEKAIENFDKCIKIEAISTEMHVEAVLSIGLCYDRLNKFDVSNDIYQQTLMKPLTKIYKFKTLLRLGVLQTHQKNFSNAISTLQEAASIEDIPELEKLHALKALTNAKELEHYFFLSK